MPSALAGIKAGQQPRKLQRNFVVSFTGPAGAAAEGDGDFLDAGDAAADQNFQKQFKAGALKRDVFDGGAANQEETGHGIADAQAAFLHRPGGPYGGERTELAGEIPIAQPAPCGVAATDGQIAAFLDRAGQLRKQLRWVLQIGVHDAQDAGVGLAPAIENGAGEPALAFTHDQANARIFASDGGNNAGGAVAAIVIDDDDFEIDPGRIERGADLLQKPADILRLAQGGNHQRQLQLLLWMVFSDPNSLQALCGPGDHGNVGYSTAFSPHEKTQSDNDGVTRLKRNPKHFDFLLVLIFTILGFLVMGYHPGLEDDGVYLTAVQADLNPALYPYNAQFFRLQVQATVFDDWMAHFVRATGVPLAWAELFWQFVSLLAVLWASKRIAQHLFAEAHAQWAGVALAGAMFTLPVAGTGLYLMDQHLHPRNIATAFILLAVSRILAERSWQAAPLLLAACLFHPLMGAIGFSFCLILTLVLLEPAPAWARPWPRAAAAMAPLAWVLGPPNAGWREALATRNYCQIYRWTWYEWLGALGPLLLFWLLWRVAQRREDRSLGRFALAVFAFCVFQQAVAMVIQAPASLVRLTPLQPMRYLQLVYFFLAVMAGGLGGKYVLKTKAWRWMVFLLVANGAMFAVQRAEFSASPHLELPGKRAANPWLEAFAWVRRNTPLDAYFALDPYYLEAKGEDYHNFRALAERSQLADAVKDAAVVIQVPVLGPDWERQVQAEEGWAHFQLADFERLKSQFGVDWVVVEKRLPAGLACPWRNRSLAVCRIP